MTLAEVLERRARIRESRCPDGGIFAPVAIVLDSLPGGDGEQSMISVFTEGLRGSSLLTRAVMVPVLRVCYMLFRVSYGGCVISDVRARLNTPEILPGFTPNHTNTAHNTQMTGKEIPRLYLCSKADRIVPVEEVLSHIAQAQNAGFDVRAEIFEDVPHVSGARIHPQRYWGAVDNVWREAVRKASVKAKL